MAKGKKQGGNMKKRMASVRRCLERLAGKYVPEVDIWAVGEMSESERKTFLLEVIDHLMAIPRFEPTQIELQKNLQMMTHFEKIKDIDMTPEQRAEEAQKNYKFWKGTSFDTIHKVEYMQMEVWERSLYATTKPRPDCPLNDNQAVMLMSLNERYAVEWMRDLCRYGADVDHLVGSTCRMLFPELEGDLNIMNPTFINFVMTTPYRNVAAEMLTNTISGMDRYVPKCPPEIHDYIGDMLMEVMRYGVNGESDVEVFIMRIMAMLSNAISNLNLRDYWKEREVGR